MNQLTLLVALLVLFVYFGGKYVPHIVKKNKEILLGVGGGLVLYSFLGLRMEGLCLDDENYPNLRDEIFDKCEQTSSGLYVDCNNECAEAVQSFMNACTEQERTVMDGSDDLVLQRLVALSQQCDALVPPPTPPPIPRDPLTTRSCSQRYPGAIDYPSYYDHDYSNNQEPARYGDHSDACKAEREAASGRGEDLNSITNIIGRCGVGEKMTLDQYMNCACSASGDGGINSNGMRLDGGLFAERYSATCRSSNPMPSLDECPYVMQEYGDGVIQVSLNEWETNDLSESQIYGYGSGSFTCRSRIPEGGPVYQRYVNNEDMHTILPDIERANRSICEVDTEYSTDGSTTRPRTPEDDPGVGAIQLTPMPFGAQYDISESANRGWIPCICPEGTEVIPPIIEDNGAARSSIGTKIEHDYDNKYSIKSVKCTSVARH